MLPVLLIALLSAAIPGSGGFSTKSDPADSAQVYVSPPKTDGQPVQVEIGIFLDEVVHIDEGENTYDVKGFLQLTWSDHRLAFDPEDADVSRKIYLENDAQLELELIWWPDVDFVNGVGRRTSTNQELLIGTDGQVDYRERFKVTLSTNFEMERFPFDSQRLKMNIESFAWSSEDLTFIKKDEIVGFSDEFSLPGWDVLSIEESIQDHQDPHGRAAFSELLSIITIERDPGFFFWKFLFPLCVVMILISGVLWIPAHFVKDRVGATLTGILTSAAYGFTVARFLPAHVYDTYLDTVIIISLIYCAAIMMVNVVNFRFDAGGRAEIAARIDLIGRVVFPLAFIALILALAPW